MVKFREAHNRVKEITLEGKEKISSVEGIKQEAFIHFCILYHEDGDLDEVKVSDFF